MSTADWILSVIESVLTLKTIANVLEINIMHASHVQSFSLHSELVSSQNLLAFPIDNIFIAIEKEVDLHIYF